MVTWSELIPGMADSAAALILSSSSPASVPASAIASRAAAVAPSLACIFVTIIIAPSMSAAVSMMNMGTAMTSSMMDAPLSSRPSILLFNRSSRLIAAPSLCIRCGLAARRRLGCAFFLCVQGSGPSQRRRPREQAPPLGRAQPMLRPENKP